jgi:hypothetical protein
VGENDARRGPAGRHERDGLGAPAFLNEDEGLAPEDVRMAGQFQERDGAVEKGGGGGFFTSGDIQNRIQALAKVVSQSDIPRCICNAKSTG